MQEKQKPTDLIKVRQKAPGETLDWKLIGERIKEQRLYLNLTQQQLADMMGMARQNIRYYEEGLVKLGRSESYLKLSKFAKHFGCTTEYLQGDIASKYGNVVNQAGERVNAESLGNLPVEKKEEAIDEYNQRKDNGEFPTSSGRKFLDIGQKYTLIPIKDKGTIKQSINPIDGNAIVSFAMDRSVYFYNSENKSAFCLKELFDNPALYQIENPKFSYLWPSEKNQPWPSSLCVTEDMKNFIAISHHIVAAQKNPDCFKCLEKVIVFFAIASLKNDSDYYKKMNSFLTHYEIYEHHQGLVETFFKTVKVLPKNLLVKLESSLSKLFEKHNSLKK